MIRRRLPPAFLAGVPRGRMAPDQVAWFLGDVAAVCDVVWPRNCRIHAMGSDYGSQYVTEIAAPCRVGFRSFADSQLFVYVCAAVRNCQRPPANAHISSRTVGKQEVEPSEMGRCRPMSRLLVVRPQHPGSRFRATSSTAVPDHDHRRKQPRFP